MSRRKNLAQKAGKWEAGLHHRRHAMACSPHPHPAVTPALVKAAFALPFFHGLEGTLPPETLEPERGGLLLAHKADFLAVELGDSGQNRTDCAGSKVDAVQLGHCCRGP